MRRGKVAEVSIRYRILKVSGISWLACYHAVAEVSIRYRILKVVIGKNDGWKQEGGRGLDPLQDSESWPCKVL